MADPVLFHRGRAENTLGVWARTSASHAQQRERGQALHGEHAASAIPPAPQALRGATKPVAGGCLGRAAFGEIRVVAGNASCAITRCFALRAPSRQAVSRHHTRRIVELFVRVGQHIGECLRVRRRLANDGDVVARRITGREEPRVAIDARDDRHARPDHESLVAVLLKPCKFEFALTSVQTQRGTATHSRSGRGGDALLTPRVRTRSRNSICRFCSGDSVAGDVDDATAPLPRRRPQPATDHLQVSVPRSAWAAR